MSQDDALVEEIVTQINAGLDAKPSLIHCLDKAGMLRDAEPLRQLFEVMKAKGQDPLIKRLAHEAMSYYNTGSKSPEMALLFADHFDLEDGIKAAGTNGFVYRGQQLVQNDDCPHRTRISEITLVEYGLVLLGAGRSSELERLLQAVPEDAPGALVWWAAEADELPAEILPAAFRKMFEAGITPEAVVDALAQRRWLSSDRVKALTVMAAEAGGDPVRSALQDKCDALAGKPSSAASHRALSEALETLRQRAQIQKAEIEAPAWSPP